MNVDLTDHTDEAVELENVQSEVVEGKCGLSYIGLFVEIFYHCRASISAPLECNAVCTCFLHCQLIATPFISCIDDVMECLPD